MSSRHRYKHYGAKRFKLVPWILLLLSILFTVQIVFGFMFRPARIESDSMAPSINNSERIIATPFGYGIRIPFKSNYLAVFHYPERGDLVLVKEQQRKERPLWYRILDTFLRFISVQQLGMENFTRKPWDRGVTVMRVIGIPGDTVRVSDYTAYIRTPGSEFFAAESETVTAIYSIEKGDIGPVRGADFPYTGYADSQYLQTGEYYLMHDNRTMNNDSTIWGPYSLADIWGKIIRIY